MNVLTKRKLILNGIVFISVFILTQAFLTYKNHPQDLWELENYLPSIIGAAVGWGIMFFFTTKNAPKGLDAPLTDERDLQLSRQYTQKFLQIVLFAGTLIIMLLYILNVRIISLDDLSMVFFLVIAVYAIGWQIYRAVIS